VPSYPVLVFFAPDTSFFSTGGLFSLRAGSPVSSALSFALLPVFSDVVPRAFAFAGKGEALGGIS
jgi:hypothetical protein